MLIDSKVKDLVNEVKKGGTLARSDISYLLQIPHQSVNASFIMYSANKINRTACDDKAEVHAQIGLNLSPCSKNCSFCSFAAKNRLFHETTGLGAQGAINLSLEVEKEGANAIYLMITGDYPFSKFLRLSNDIKTQLNSDTVLIANIGDFKDSQARELKDAGFTGIYHAVRMGEGRDTDINPDTRIKTMEAAKRAGLMVGTCVEPLGPEHSNEEIVNKILIGREMEPCFSGAMRRINPQNSELAQYGMISEYRMAYLVAVVRLAMSIKIIGNCTHEPNVLGATAGASLFWAEVGSNPRDAKPDTSKGRGLDLTACKEMFKEAEFDILDGPSRIYNP